MNNVNNADGVLSQSNLTCNSVTEDYFTSLSNLNSIFLMGLNIQSLNSKFNKLTELIDSLGSKFKPPDILALQETFLSNDAPPPQLKGYHPIVSSNRAFSRGVGWDYLLIKTTHMTSMKNFLCLLKDVLKLLHVIYILVTNV